MVYQHSREQDCGTRDSATAMLVAALDPRSVRAEAQRPVIVERGPHRASPEVVPSFPLLASIARLLRL